MSGCSWCRMWVCSQASHWCLVSFSWRIKCASCQRRSLPIHEHQAVDKVTAQPCLPNISWTILRHVNHMTNRNWDLLAWCIFQSWIWESCVTLWAERSPSVFLMMCLLLLCLEALSSLRHDQTNWKPNVALYLLITDLKHALQDKRERWREELIKNLW